MKIALGLLLAVSMLAAQNTNDTPEAHAAVAKKGSHFQAVFRRLLPRLGYQSAIWAVAHRLCRLVWKILHEGVRFIEQGREFYARCAARLEVGHQIAERQSGVDDVFNHQDVPAFDRHVEILHDAHFARSSRRRTQWCGWWQRLLRQAATSAGARLHRARTRRLAEPSGRP